MKKVIKIIILSILATTLLGVMLTLMINGEDVSSGLSFNFGYTYDDMGYSVGDFTTDQTINEFDIDWVAGDINFELYDGDLISVSEKGANSDNYRLRYKIDGDKLSIKYKKSEWLFSLNNTSKNLTIKIPQSYSEQINSIEYDGASAGITVKNLNVEDIDISCASGDIYFENCKLDSIECSAVSADVDFINCSANEVSIESVSGNINYTGTVINIELNTVSGRIECKAENVLSKLDVETVSGNALLYMPSGSGFEIDFSSVSGDFNCNTAFTKKDGAYIVGNGNGRYSFDSVSGSVDVFITEG